MDEIISKLRIKQTLYTTLMAGILILVLFGGFFGLFALNEKVASDDVLAQMLEDTSTRPEVTSRCFAFYVVDNCAYPYPIYTNDISYYGTNAERIINKAIDQSNGSFSFNNKFFTVQSKQVTGRTIYAVYDRSASRSNMMRILFILIVLYFVALIIITIIAYIYSSITTAPVKNAFDKQSDLIANASHELKTPLTVISTNLSVMESEPTSTIQENSKWIESINGQISRMDTLIKNMLELSRLEHSNANKSMVNFGEITKGACLEFEVMCFEKQAKLVSNIADGVFIYGNQDELERLVIILLDNALKYCGANGKVGCKLSISNKKAHLTVLNTGEVITKEDAEHVFDRFYRSDGARANPDGNSFGLGLSIAQATVIGHNGKISCRGIEGKGTIFEVVLPIINKNQLKTSEKKGKQNISTQTADTTEPDDIIFCDDGIVNDVDVPTKELSNDTDNQASPIDNIQSNTDQDNNI